MDYLRRLEPLLNIPISDAIFGATLMSWSLDNRLVLLTKERAATFEFTMQFPSKHDGFNFFQSLIRHPKAVAIQADAESDEDDIQCNLLSSKFWFSKGTWSKPGVIKGQGSLLCLISYSGEVFIYERGVDWHLRWCITDLYLEDRDFRNSCTLADLSSDFAMWLSPEKHGNVISTPLILITKNNQLVVITITCVEHSWEVSIGITFEADLADDGNVKSVEFLELSNELGYLCTGSTLGNVDLYCLDLALKKVDHIGTILKENFMPVNFLCLGVWDMTANLYVVTLATGSYVRSFLLGIENGKAETINECVMVVGTLNITGLQAVSSKQLYVTVKNGLVEKLSINVTGKLISIEKEDSLQKGGDIGFNGIVLSPNSSLLAILETISVPYDHLDIREPHSIKLYNTQKKSTLLASCQSHEAADIPKCHDIHETIRILSQTDNSFGNLEIFNPLVELRLLKCLPESAKTSQRIQMLEGEARLKWGTEVLNDLKEKTTEFTEEQLVIRNMLQEFHYDGKYGQEVCYICEDVIPSIHSVKCMNQHSVVRCSKTNLLVDISEMFYECTVCRKFYHLSLSAIEEPVCLFCTKDLDLYPPVRF